MFGQLVCCCVFSLFLGFDLIDYCLEHFVRKNVARCKKVCTRYKMHLALSWTLEGWRPTLVPTVTH